MLAGLDGAHYFLHEDDTAHLLDFETNGYTVVTYCASRLPPQLLAAADVMLVTCESDDAEIEALRRRCSTCQPVDPADWRASLRQLAQGQAIALPITEEAGGTLQLFQVGRRMTPHVRTGRSTWTCRSPTRRPSCSPPVRASPCGVRTLREFVSVLESRPRVEIAPCVQRGDCSRWIGDVFGDWELADERRDYEEEFRAGVDVDVIPELADDIRRRYDLSDSDDVPAAPAALRVA